VEVFVYINLCICVRSITNHVPCCKFPRLFTAANKLAFAADSSEILVGEYEFIGVSVLTVSILYLLAGICLTAGCYSTRLHKKIQRNTVTSLQCC